MKIFLVSWALTLVFAQGRPSPTPTPAFSAKPTPAKGIEIKEMVKPQNANRLRWEKVIVGQESIDGAEIIGTSKSSVWRRLGFQSGDVIVRIDNNDLHSSADFNRAIRGIIDLKNSKVEIKVLRDKQEILFNFQLSW